MRKRSLLVLAPALVAVLLAASCTKSATTASTGSGGPVATLAPGAAAPGTGGKAIGFIFVGPKDDFGYNQAAYQGSQEVAKAYPDLKVVTAENVPETAKAEDVMEDMITKDGAKIIFATSYGHLAAATNIAKKHPDVVVVHQGGLLKDKLPNLGTYFGTVYEPVYLAGIAAGASTKSNKLGYVVAFPIPQTLANINAFELGAQSVNKDATTTVVFTSNWCDPAKQAEAAKSLLDQGVDVISQHQDCTKTIIETTEKAGKMSVGYHADASGLAPSGWVAGSEWNWGPLYTDIVKTTLDGKFVGSKYNADYREGLRTGSNPFVQSKYGSMVSEDTKKKIDAATSTFKADGSPFTGPVMAQDGSEKVAAGKTPTYADIETMDYLVKGVVGTLPSS
jgi:basic membrane protein A